MPSSDKPTRKLAAIMFTDIAGYTEQMSKDEDKAFALIKKKRELLLPLVEKYEGKLIKEIGDGTLTSYFKADNAIDCASTFQSKTNTDLNVRAGIHTGEVIVDKEDVFGDVVNVASRLESIAVPGSIFVSKETIDKLEISDKVNLISLGMQSLKGVGRLIEVYAIKDESIVVPNPDDYTENKIDVHSDDEVPSIAIIPFKNKGAEEDVFYAYGISADLITDCSSAGLIRVSGLSDIEKLDYTNLDNTELSQKLFVRYISQGMLWKMGDMFQLSIELYDTKDKKVVWSDRWQEKWDNLPTIKMKLSDGLLKALDTFSKSEKTVETTNTEAYELYLKAKYMFSNSRDMDNVRGLLKKAIALDNNLIIAKNLLGLSYRVMNNSSKAEKIFSSNLIEAENTGNLLCMGMALGNLGAISEKKGEYRKALDYFTRALESHKKDDDKNGIAKAYCSIGFIIWKRFNKREKGIEYLNNSLKIFEELGDKNLSAMTMSYFATIYNDMGDLDKALVYNKRGLELSKIIGDKYSILNLSRVRAYYYDKIGAFNKALDSALCVIEMTEKFVDKIATCKDYLYVSLIYFNKKEYQIAQKYLSKSLVIQDEIKYDKLKLETTTYLFLIYKHFEKAYNAIEIYNLIKVTEEIDYKTYFAIYQLLNDKSYLETAYKQLQEEINGIEDEFKTKFLSYPIPSAIVEEWERVQ